MANLKMYALAGVLILLAFFAGKYSGPTSEQLKETSHTEIDKDVNTKKDLNTVTTTKETKLPDGTIILETRKEKEVTTQTESQTISKTDKTLEKTVDLRPSYRVGAMYEPVIKGFQESTYAGIIEKRLFSEVYLGISVSSRRTAGLTLSFGF